MKKILKIMMFFSASLLILVGCGDETGADELPDEEDTTFLSFATSGQGGTFYVAGSGIASNVNSNVDGVQANAEVTQGVVENVRLMAFGETEMGFSYGSTAHNIQRGIADFEGHQYEGIRAVASIHDGAMNFVTLEGSGIESIDDLAGQTVSIGPHGSGSTAVAEEFFQSIGMWDEIDIQYLSFDDSADSLRDGHIDAFVIGGTTPVPALIELEATHDVVLLSVEQEYIDTFLEDHPYHLAYTIPDDGYETIDDPVETIGYAVFWVADEEIEDEIIYDMLEATFSDEGRAYLENVQLAFNQLAPGIDRFEAIDLPLHPGAEQFYEDHNLE